MMTDDNKKTFVMPKYDDLQKYYKAYGLEKFRLAFKLSSQDLAKNR